MIFIFFEKYPGIYRKPSLPSINYKIIFMPLKICCKSENTMIVSHWPHAEQAPDGVAGSLRWGRGAAIAAARLGLLLSQKDTQNGISAHDNFSD